MPLAYVLLDDNLRVIEWNPTAERIFGYARHEALGMGPPFEPILPSAAWPDAERLLQRIQSGDMSAHSVNNNRTKDGHSITC